MVRTHDDHGSPSAAAPPPGSPTVLWDFDGTLVARNGNWRAALLTALDRVAAGHGVTQERLREGLRDSFPWHRPETPHPQLNTPEVWWRDLDPALRRAYLIAGTDEATAGRAAAQVRDVYVDARHWSVFDDTRPALKRLRDHGYRNVIVSNHVPELGDLVVRLGLGDLIDDVLTSAVTGYEKPHPAMFALALELIGHPGRMWMVGDNPVADVAGAEAVGIPAVLVRGTDPATASGLEEAVDRILAREAGPRRPS